MKNESKRELELYLHIPFCVRKCYYCDFLSMPAEETLRRHYVDMLLEEIKCKSKACSGYLVSSVFFGGGTPSLLPGVQIKELMDALRQNFCIREDAEITVECNPGTLTRQKLIFYKAAGINRLSLGLQSASNRELQRIGRIHTFQDFLVSFDLARKIGFTNINVDVISALPNQTLQDWEYTLKRVLETRPEHISAYSLIVEPGTPFYEQYGEDELCREQGVEPKDLPNEKTERQMYQMTQELLGQKGYRRYEISNYALPGRACRHNIGYWQMVPYLGLGLGSSSFLENIRFSNTTGLSGYLKGNFGDLEKILNKSPSESLSFSQGNQEQSLCFLNKKQQMEEFMFLGLRMTDGVLRSAFEERFGLELESIYGNVLKKLQRQGLLGRQEGRIFLTETGISVSNYAPSEFLLEE